MCWLSEALCCSQLSSNTKYPHQSSNETSQCMRIQEWNSLTHDMAVMVWADCSGNDFTNL